METKELYDILFKLWDGEAGAVLYQGKMYKVFTPNGPENPTFISQDDTEYAGALSTGVFQAAEPKSPNKPKRAPAKAKAVTNKPSVTDVGGEE